MGIQKMIASLLAGAAGVAAQFGLEFSPEVISSATTLLTALVVWIFPNKG